jgi:hypothetical protein
MILPFKDINAYERLGACRFFAKKKHYLWAAGLLCLHKGIK